MGLISTGIKAGAVYGIARQGIKAYEHHNQQQQQRRSQDLCAAPPQALTRDINGYAHQNWCNGQCQGQCNGTGYAHQAYCNGQCGCLCNGDQSQTIGHVDSRPQTMSYPHNQVEEQMLPKY